MLHLGNKNMKTLTFSFLMFSLIAALALQTVNPVVREKYFPIVVKPNKQYVVWQDKMIQGIKSFESFKPAPYRCPAGVLTVGYGHTGKFASRHVNKQQAEKLLIEEVDYYRRIVLRNVKVPLTEYQLCALTSFAFNAGEGNLRKLINGRNRLNSGNYDSVEKLMPMYRKGGGKVLRGLVKRRTWEVSVWNGAIDMRG
jgi:lysozyme